MFRILVLSFIFAVLGEELEDMSDLRRKEPAYFFTFTKTLLAGKNETVCLTLQDAALPTKAVIDLKIKERHHTLTKMMHSDHSCFDFPVPLHNSTEVISASIHLQLQLNGSIYTSHNQDPILIYPNSDLTFVETDRAVYKEGEKIRIRILVLSNDLRPSKKRYSIEELKIVNPQGFIVAAWESVPTELGLAQVEYQLSEQTVLGKWKIKCNGASKYFQVNRYILPRFDVEIFAPKMIHTRTDVIKITICAKYSFGMYVKGIALLKISYPTHNSTSKMETLQNGCAAFKLTNNELNLLSITENNVQQMNVIATITERGTNQIETQSTSVGIKLNPFELKFSDENNYFQPGLPYIGKLKVLDKVNVEDHYVQICYQIAVRKSWNIKLQECSDYKFDNEGSVQFTILPVKETVVEIVLSAKLLNHTYGNVEDRLTLKRWYSSSNSYISIDRNMKSISKCRAPRQFTVYYTANKFRSNETVTFYYMLKTRNEILQMRKIQHNPRRQLINFRSEFNNVIGDEHKYIKTDNYVDRFILKFKLHNKILSKSQLMVFYFIRGEIVAGVADIFVEKCLPNTVQAKWSHEKLYPGEVATLNIRTSPNSLCAISAIDDATTYLSNPKAISINNILQTFLQPREIKPSNRANCIFNQKKKMESMYLQEELAEIRSSNYVPQTSNDYDTYETFNDFGISSITNMKTISKVCSIDGNNLEMAPKLYSITSTSYDILNDGRGVSTRSYFPETWLWELAFTSNYGQAEVSRHLPHTITSWMTNIVCIGENDGIGISPKLEITAFQPFFIDIILPYSIKRHETLQLKVIIYNYLNYSLPIRTRLGEMNGLQMIKANDNTRSNCVDANDVHVHVFHLKGVGLGKVNISVSSEIESSYPSKCGPETIINKRDVVIKTLLIEPEGHVSEITKSALLCGEDKVNNVTWKFDIPKDVVKGSETAKVILNSDLMGPIIQNLEKFITIPTGCGEQIMAVLAPNLHVLRYLKMNNMLNQGLRQRAVKNIKIGYQRILDYVHKDGSFSAFGYHDPVGSMFLTAFVVRTLQQSKEYIYVDKQIIHKAKEWISKHQLENGCFAAVSHVFQDMGGTSTENSTAALTAYVIISLLESNIQISDSVRTNAMYCIRGQHNPDKYTLAISTYALYLLNWKSEADRYLSRLIEVATTDGMLMWWSNQSGPSPANIEMTGYVLMSLVHNKSSSNLLHANAVVRWLSTQRGSQGGFLSTQDSVVALDALSRYATLVKGKDPELLVQISSENQKYDINVHKGDRIKSKEIALNSIPKMLRISSSGAGCLLAQLHVSYNLNKMISSEAFRVAVDVSPVSTIDKCSVALISTCVSYVGIGHSNMAVLEVTMPSGYEPDRATLFKLTDASNTKVKKFEEYDNRVVLYFSQLNNEPICVPFNINENVIVDDQVDATVKLYDYYNPDLKVFTTYRMNKCQPNEVGLIPELPVNNTSRNVSITESEKKDVANIQGIY